MKRILLLLFLLPLAYVNAQEPTFLRVYNAQGKKVNKGYLLYLSDTSITLTRKMTTVTETPVSQIHLIKSKRTTAHRILVTTAVVAGIAVVAAAFVVSSKNGSGRGFLHPRGNRRKKEAVNPIPIIKPYKRYKVDGNAQTWKDQRARLALLF